MLTREMLIEFKTLTEQRWRQRPIDPSVFGFQVQQGTRWNPGLSDLDIARYESSLGTRFPNDFRAFLRVMNGTDLPTLNVYGESGEPHRTSIGVYSFPADLEAVQQRMEDIRQSRTEIENDLRKQGFELSPEDRLVPVSGHRYVVCSSNLDLSMVLSVVVRSVDATVYANSLREYLQQEFLGRP